MLAPLNLKGWIEEHRHLLKPPVGNRQMYIENDDFIVMIVGGPNGRKDYHYEEGEELFYQIEGDIQLKIINTDGTPQTIDIREGEMFLLPPRIPHSPQRPAGTVGLVLERYRKEGEQDKLLWFCENCNNLLHEAMFPMKNIVTELPLAMSHYFSREDLRSCKKCATVMQPPVPR